MAVDSSKQRQKKSCWQETYVEIMKERGFIFAAEKFFEGKTRTRQFSLCRKRRDLACFTMIRCTCYWVYGCRVLYISCPSFHVIYHVKLLNSVPMHIRNRIGIKPDCNRIGPNRIECEIVRCELKTELVRNVKRP